MKTRYRGPNAFSVFLDVIEETLSDIRTPGMLDELSHRNIIFSRIVSLSFDNEEMGIELAGCFTA